jgi:hypothetical protein
LPQFGQPDGICKVPGCRRNVYLKGNCITHYYRYRRKLTRAKRAS